MSESSRLFFALWPDDITRDKVAALTGHFQEKYGGRAIARESLHVTLVFLGETPNSCLPTLAEIAANVATPSFNLTLHHAGYWGKGIFWLGPEDSPPALLALVAALREGLQEADISFDEKPFVPHMTLLRDAKCRESPGVIMPIEFSVKRFVLARSVPGSKAVRYEAVREFSLG
ncbi:MAG: RNA 2',3'-cyclic phosphodiesterase [Pseudomonadota bacterium]